MTAATRARAGCEHTLTTLAALGFGLVSQAFVSLQQPPPEGPWKEGTLAGLSRVAGTSMC
jgi:hypothetical protein